MPLSLSCWHQVLVVVLDEVINLDIISIKLPGRLVFILQKSSVEHPRSKLCHTLCRAGTDNVGLCSPRGTFWCSWTSNSWSALYIKAQAKTSYMLTNAALRMMAGVPVKVPQTSPAALMGRKQAQLSAPVIALSGCSLQGKT